MLGKFIHLIFAVSVHHLTSKIFKGWSLSGV
nr:MAG TPA: hypothetical protein [Herelleviridae sp.]